MTLYFAVDIPNPDSDEGYYQNVDWFPTEAEAIAFAKERYGADDEGKIGLVSGPHGEDEPDEWWEDNEPTECVEALSAGLFG